MLTIIGVILTGVSKLALVILILSFSIWTYRRLKLRSLPWVGVYLIVPLILPISVAWMTGPVMDSMVSRGISPLGMSMGGFTSAWRQWHIFIRTLIDLILIVLVLSDIAFLLSKAGVEVEGKLLSKLLSVRERSTSFGIVITALMLVGPAIWLSLYFYYVA